MGVSSRTTSRGRTHWQQCRSTVTPLPQRAPCRSGPRPAGSRPRGLPQAADIYRIRFDSDRGQGGCGARMPSCSGRSAEVASCYGVNSKTVRDIWNRVRPAFSHTQTQSAST